MVQRKKLSREQKQFELVFHSLMDIFATVQPTNTPTNTNQLQGILCHGYHNIRTCHQEERNNHFLIEAIPSWVVPISSEKKKDWEEYNKMFGLESLHIPIKHEKGEGSCSVPSTARIEDLVSTFYVSNKSSTSGWIFEETLLAVKSQLLLLISNGEKNATFGRLGKAIFQFPKKNEKIIVFRIWRINSKRCIVVPLINEIFCFDHICSIHPTEAVGWVDLEEGHLMQKKELCAKEFKSYVQ